jgi:flagellum-specific peptidoglycan hydrolase FlgJ
MIEMKRRMAAATMRTMGKWLFPAAVLCWTCGLQAKAPVSGTGKKATSVTTTAALNPVYVEYIKSYYKIAIRQQKKYKIPASITLAQALLESGGGQSYLALAGNNHFGVKCTDWNGLNIYKYDAGEYACFRKYLSVNSSFDDHSRFIAERSFYRSLFKLSRTDYKSWAKGLNKCGYAYDPQYGDKLIRLIELYRLYYYDTAGENDPPQQLQTPAAKPTVKPAVAKVAAPAQKKSSETISPVKK